MPRQAGFQVENNFIKGLITEATGLNSPENSCTETYNCVFSEKGLATRRVAFDYESTYNSEVIDKSNSVTVEYLWSGAGANGDRDIVVVQVGTTLYYYDADEDAPLSAGLFGFTTDLLDFEVGSSTDVDGNVCQFASGNGFLFVVHPLCEPFYVALNSSATAITETQITIKCRDLDGDKDDPNYNNFDTRPTGTADVHHTYNLYNQGWYFDARLGNGFSSPSTIGHGVVYTYWDSQRTDFPSNADVWWLIKDPQDNFNLDWIDDQTMGNRPAPKGHYILDEFDTNRGTLSGLSTPTERDSNGKRPSTTAFFASRIWYSGVDDQEYNQKIYYSQIIEGTEFFGRCYQANDPTSSEIADLLPSDGGVISIPDVGKVIKLFPMANSIIVFGTKGVWSIGGSEGVGFKATDYAIRKISSVESLSPLSFVDVFGSPIWWNTDGIYTVGTTGIDSEQVVSLSDDTIKTFFVDILSDNKRYVKGAFNPRTKIVRWVYRSTAASNTQENFEYDRILNFNILSKAFYPWTISISDTSPLICGIVVCKGPLSAASQVEVVDAADELVVDANGDQVIISAFADVAASYSFRYYTTTQTDVAAWDATWSQNIGVAWVDWPTANENLDYESYFFTGYKVHGDASRFFENNYLTVTMSTEENASCFVQGVWDYANSSSGARFTNPQQIYISRTFRGIQQTRKKIRGRGRSSQFKFYSESGKPFTIHGWSAWETQNASV